MQRDGQIRADDWAAHFEGIFQTAPMKLCKKNKKHYFPLWKKSVFNCQTL